MTVRRSKEQIFQSSRAEVSQKIRGILGHNPPYVNFVEEAAETLFMTTVKPNFFLVGTEMTIKLEDLDDATRVLVEIESQSIIIGDKYNIYNRYIDDFLSAIDQDPASSDSV